MAATIEISVPDTLMAALGEDVGELSHRAVEALVAQAYRSGRLTHAQAGEVLGLDRWQTDAFLKGEQAQRACETEEFSADLARLRRMGN